MSEPKNPDTIVIKNSFYPNGLTEGNIYDYYQKVKSKLLKEVIGKNLTFFFATDINNIVVMRRAKTTTGYLRLDYSNYDQMISGRTISIHSNFGRSSEFGIIDIDIDDFNVAKKSVYELYYFILRYCHFVQKIEIRFTGKESFHLICYTKRPMYIDNFRISMRNFLLEQYQSDEYSILRNYTIIQKRISGIPNIDLSSNKYLGSYISLHSLSVIGLQCMEINVEKIMKFKKEMAKI